MIINLASVPGGLKNGKAGSLLYQHPLYRKRWWMRELGRVSYLGGSEYLTPSQLSIEFQEPVLEPDPATGVSKVSKVNNLRYQSMLYRHNREQSWEFVNRGRRAYYHNFVRTIVNALVSHALKKEVTREGDEALDTFWKGVDSKRKRSIGAFMRTGLRWAAVEGIMWACVDAPPKSSKHYNGGLPYAYWVNPLDVLDWEVDDEGELIWLKQFVYASTTRTWNQAFEPRYRFRIWSRNGVQTYETDAQGGGQKVVPEYTRAYDIGRVPLVPLFSVRDGDDTVDDGVPLAGDLCKAANHVFNLGSLLSEIGYKQTFSWLTIPDKHVDALAAGLNTAFGYDPVGGGKPEYISPDAEQARVLMEMVSAGIEQARQAIGVGRGRSEGSMEKSSGDALELESEDKRSILADVASEAQDFEVRLAEMVQAFKAPGKAASKGTTIRYAMDFDMRSFESEVNDALALSKFKLSDEVTIEMVQDLVRKKFGGMPADQLKVLTDSVRKQFEEDAKAAEAARAAALVPAVGVGMGKPGDKPAGPGGKGAAPGDAGDEPASAA